MTLEGSNVVVSKNQLVVVRWEMQDKSGVTSNVHKVKTNTTSVVCKGEVGRGKRLSFFVGSECVKVKYAQTCCKICRKPWITSLHHVIGL